MTTVKLAENNYYSIPHVLRTLAEDVERGDYGEAVDAAVVLRSADGKVNVFGGGARMTPERAHMVFLLGADEIRRMHT